MNKAFSLTTTNFIQFPSGDTNFPRIYLSISLAALHLIYIARLIYFDYNSHPLLHA